MTYAPAQRYSGLTVSDAGLFLERAFVVLAFLLFSQALLPTVLASEADPESSALLRLMWLPVYGVTLILAFLRPWRFISSLAAIWLIMACVALACASTLWAIEPDIALRRAFALVMTTIFGVYVAYRFGWRDVIGMLAITSAILAVGNLVASLATPGFGVHQDVNAGAWRGMFFEKNALGAEMARGAMIFLCAAIFQPRRRWMWAGFILLAVFLVIMSRSATSLLSVLLAFGVIAGVGLLRRGPATALVFTYLGVIVAGTLGVFLITDTAGFLELLGKDATLTGRTDIWVLILDSIQERPWLGYGYHTYWHDPLGPAFFIREATQWPVPSAHNGWLELALSLGWVGVGLFGLAFFIILIMSISRIGGGREVYFALTYNLLFLLYSMSESSILDRNSFAWVLFVIVATKLFTGERASDGRRTSTPSGYNPPRQPYERRRRALSGR